MAEFTPQSQSRIASAVQLTESKPRQRERSRHHGRGYSWTPPIIKCIADETIDSGEMGRVAVARETAPQTFAKTTEKIEDVVNSAEALADGDECLVSWVRVPEADGPRPYVLGVGGSTTPTSRSVMNLDGAVSIQIPNFIVTADGQRDMPFAGAFVKWGNAATPDFAELDINGRIAPVSSFDQDWLVTIICDGQFERRESTSGTPRAVVRLKFGDPVSGGNTRTTWQWEFSDSWPQFAFHDFTTIVHAPITIANETDRVWLTGQVYFGGDDRLFFNSLDITLDKLR